MRAYLTILGMITTVAFVMNMVEGHTTLTLITGIILVIVVGLLEFNRY